MIETTFTKRLGILNSAYGSCTFSFEQENRRMGFFTCVADEPGESRKSCVWLQFAPSELATLCHTVQELEQEITRLHASGQVCGWKLEPSAAARAVVRFESVHTTSGSIQLQILMGDDHSLCIRVHFFSRDGRITPVIVAIHSDITYNHLLDVFREAALLQEAQRTPAPPVAIRSVTMPHPTESLPYTPPTSTVLRIVDAPAPSTHMRVVTPADYDSLAARIQRLDQIKERQHAKDTGPQVLFLRVCVILALAVAVLYAVVVGAFHMLGFGIALWIICGLLITRHNARREKAAR